MCGRLAIVASYEEILRYYEIHAEYDLEVGHDGIERYNFHPTLRPSAASDGRILWQHMPIIHQKDGERIMQPMVWPFIPAWAKGSLPKFATSNCRSHPDEPFSTTMAGKPTFRNAWRRQQRCLIPANWFYEWDPTTKPKQPWKIAPLNEAFFSFAGLWDRSVSAEGEAIDSFTLITTEPNALLRDQVHHHRSPVAVKREDWSCWLSGPAEQAEQLLAPYPAEEMHATPIGLAINNPTFDEPEVAEAQRPPDDLLRPTEP